jgi:rhomboid protease GluP
MYVLALTLSLSEATLYGGLFTILAPSAESLNRLGMGGSIPWQQGRWWSLVTANYLHGSLLHIAINMLWLHSIGPLVEALFGPSRFIIIYTLAGVSGSVVSIIVGVPYFVGASGAIFGLFAALILYGRYRGGTYGSTIFRQALLWAGLVFFFGFITPKVDVWGHLGGFLGGFFAAFLLGYQEKTAQSFWHHVLAVMTILFIGACFSVMVISFFMVPAG